MLTGNGNRSPVNLGRKLGPSTRVVETGLKRCFRLRGTTCVELRQQQEQLRREQEKMRRSMELAEQRAKDEARRRDEYAKSLEAKFDKERQEYRRQVCLSLSHAVFELSKK